MFAREFEERFFGDRACVRYEYRGAKNEVWVYAIDELRRYTGKDVLIRIIDAFESGGQIIAFITITFSDGSVARVELSYENNELRIKRW